jgi:hypothetical protein
MVMRRVNPAEEVFGELPRCEVVAEGGWNAVFNIMKDSFR